MLTKANTKQKKKKRNQSIKNESKNTDHRKEKRPGLLMPAFLTGLTMAVTFMFWCFFRMIRFFLHIYDMYLRLEL